MNKICVVVPTYEEAENLPKLAEEIEKVIQREDFRLIVVDDNSPDGTADIAERLNERYGNIVVYRRPSKLGIGSAIRDGIKIALSFPDSERIVTMDADLSHDPKDLPSLLRIAEKTDLVQGSRYVKGGRITGWSFSRRVVSHVANYLCRLLLRTGLYEHTTYFRVYSRECAQTVLKNVHCDRYEWAIGSILVTKHHNFRIQETPISFTCRVHGKSKLKPYDILQWGSYICKAFLKRHLNLKETMDSQTRIT
jgi:dolichol-phosphate mannosyltransferase